MTGKICEAQLRVFFKEGTEKYHHEAKMGLNCPDCDTEITTCTICKKKIRAGQRVICVRHTIGGVDRGDYVSETNYTHQHYGCYKKIIAKTELICDKCGAKLGKCDYCHLDIMEGEVLNCQRGYETHHQHDYCYREYCNNRR